MERREIGLGDASQVYCLVRPTAKMADGGDPPAAKALLKGRSRRKRTGSADEPTRRGPAAERVKGSLQSHHSRFARLRKLMSRQKRTDPPGPNQLEAENSTRQTTMSNLDPGSIEEARETKKRKSALRGHRPRLSTRFSDLQSRKSTTQHRFP